VQDARNTAEPSTASILLSNITETFDDVDHKEISTNPIAPPASAELPRKILVELLAKGMVPPDPNTAPPTSA
jgi:hypothetical protein